MIRRALCIVAIGVLCTVVILILLPDSGPHYGLFLIEEDAILTQLPTRPAVYHEGTHSRTYFGYYASSDSGDGRVMIRYFDEATKVLSDAVTLWGDWGGPPGDDHAAPSVVVLQYQTGDHTDHSGKVLVAAAEHGSATEGHGRLEVRRSTNVEDVQAWDSAVSIRTVGSTYAQLVEMSDGKIFLFIRVRAVFEGELTHNVVMYYTSTDAGSTWSGPTELFHHSLRGSNYVKVTENADHTEIHAMFNTATYGDPQEGAARYHSIYYAWFDGTNWKNIEVDNLTLPLDSSTSGRIPDLVYDTDATPTEEDWTFLADIQLDSGGNPYLLFMNFVDWGDDPFPNYPTDLTGDVYRANYSSGSWNIEAVGTTGQFGTYAYPAGAAFDPMDVDVVYITPYRSGTTKNTQLQRFDRVDGVWTKTAAIAGDSKGDVFRLQAVRNARSETGLRLLYCYTARYEFFGPGQWDSTMYAYLALATAVTEPLP